MHCSAPLKDIAGGLKPQTIKITILKADPPRSDNRTSGVSAPATDHSLKTSPMTSPMSSQSDEEKRRLNEVPVVENLRSSTRKKKILWQRSVQEHTNKVQYVNVATAAGISPKEYRETKSTSGSGGLSTTPSPVEEGMQTFSEAISDRCLSLSSESTQFSKTRRDALPLIYQVPSESSKSAIFKLKVPRRSVDNLQTLSDTSASFQSPSHLVKEKKVKSLASFIDTTRRGGETDQAELPKVLEEMQGEVSSPMIRELFLKAGLSKKTVIRSTF